MTNPSFLWSIDLKQTPIRVASTKNLALLATVDRDRRGSWIAAIDVVDGTRTWELSFTHGMVSGIAVAEPTGSSGPFILVSVLSTDLLHGRGLLLALDDEGRERWRWSPGFQQLAAPVIGHNRICLVAEGDQLIIIDRANGQQRAQFQLPLAASFDAPAVSGEIVFIPCRGPHLMAMGLDGNLFWQLNLEPKQYGWLDRTPVVVASRIISAGSFGNILGLDADNGQLLWRAAPGPSRKRPSAPAADLRFVYVGGRDGVYALTLEDGSLAWSCTTDRQVEAMPVVIGDTVYVTCHDHNLYGLDSSSGQKLWHYLLERRIELPPLIFSREKEAREIILLTDRGGVVTAVQRSYTAVDLVKMGLWQVAATFYTEKGEYKEAAALYTHHGQHERAAELWLDAGDKIRAAESYQLAGKWQNAAQLWQAMKESGRQVQALESYASILEKTSDEEGDKAAAWEELAELLDQLGEVDQAAECRRRAIQYRKLPVLVLQVSSEGLVCQHWSLLEFGVRNDGFGVARKVQIRAGGDRYFAGEVVQTQQIPDLTPGRQYTTRLDVKPLEYGDHVPLRLTIEYIDHTGNTHFEAQTIYIPVAMTPAQRGTGLDVQVAELALSDEARKLFDIIDRYLPFEDDLRQLCFDLGVNYDDLGEKSRKANARVLVCYLDQRSHLSHLKGWLRRNRPNIELP